jgi:hypothetical protein
VALAADADAPEEEVRSLAMNVPNARMLPFVMLSDAEGGYLAGHSGLLNQPKLLELLAKGS